MTAIITETRERFLLAIAKEIAPERIEEIHFFQPIRQGGVESGVAVIAATLPVDRQPIVHEAPLDLLEGVETAEPPEPPEHLEPRAPEPAVRALRYTVFSSSYRLTLKGPDRGRWETTVAEEADAPLITVETVVRGVQRRSGDVEDPERMDGNSVREVVAPRI